MNTHERLESWRIQSPEEKGLHAVVTPNLCECQHARMYRLNLRAGQEFTLESGQLELHPVLIAGAAQLSGSPELSQRMRQYDSLYLPGNERVTIRALEDCVFYIAGAEYSGIGQMFFHSFKKVCTSQQRHFVAGTGSDRRDVYLTLSETDSASRLICGLTWGSPGGWTSWPPHQHEAYLEELYCYFDTPLPRFGIHISYLEDGGVHQMAAHPVWSGTVVQVPAGYHPTVSCPGSRNAYFWILAARSPESRRRDLAAVDPLFP